MNPPLPDDLQDLIQMKICEGGEIMCDHAVRDNDGTCHFCGFNVIDDLRAQVEQLKQERDVAQLYADSEDEEMKEEYALCRKLLMDRTHDMMNARHNSAAAQAHAQQLREALTLLTDTHTKAAGVTIEQILDKPVFKQVMADIDARVAAAVLAAQQALAIPSDTAALNQWGAKLLLECAKKFSGEVGYNFVAADGYANAIDIAAELLFMADELEASEVMKGRT